MRAGRVFSPYTALAVLCILTVSGASADDASLASERARAAQALGERAETGDREAIAALIPLLHSPDSKLRYHAHWGLVGAGRFAMPDLLDEYRRQGDDQARARVARVFAGVGLEARAALPEMRRELANPDGALLGEAAAAIGAMRARAALPELIAAYVTSRKISDQRQMIRAMRRIGSDQSERRAKQRLVAALGEELEAPNVGTYGIALSYVVGLYRVASDDPDFEFPTREELRPLVPGLVAALEGPDAEVTLEATRGLTLAGIDAAPAAGLFERMLYDPESEHAARKALESIDSAETRSMLARHRAHAEIERRIRREYVPADHLTRTRLLPFWLWGKAEDGVRLEVRFLTTGRELVRPEIVVLTLESYSEQPRLEGVDAVEWIADGVAMRMADMDASRGLTQLGVMERLSGAMPLESFLTLAWSSRLGLHVGPLRLDVQDADQTALRYLVRKMPGSTGDAPAAVD